MKKIVIFAAASAVATVGLASPIVSDTFTYVDGDLTTVSGGTWANHSGSGGFIQVVNEEAVVTHGGGSREDVNISFGIKSGIIYYGIDISVDDLGAPYSGTDNEYFASFRDGFDLNARTDIVPSTGGGDYSVGIATSAGSADAVWATDLDYDTTYRIVVKYDVDQDQTTLWVDATSSSDTSIMGADGTQNEPMSSFALRQSSSSENETIRVDNLVVSRDFGDVAIPEPTTIALFFAGLAGLMIRRVRG